LKIRFCFLIVKIYKLQDSKVKMYKTPIYQ
jgi:hypothetical protein